MTVAVMWGGVAEPVASILTRRGEARIRGWLVKGEGAWDSSETAGRFKMIIVATPSYADGAGQEDA